MTDDELAALRQRSQVVPANQWTYELTWCDPLTSLDPKSLSRSFVALQRKASLVVMAGEDVVLRIENGENATTTEPHLSSWLRAVDDRSVLLAEVDRLRKLNRELAAAIVEGVRP